MYFTVKCDFFGCYIKCFFFLLSDQPFVKLSQMPVHIWFFLLGGGEWVKSITVFPLFNILNVFMRRKKM